MPFFLKKRGLAKRAEAKGNKKSKNREAKVIPDEENEELSEDSNEEILSDEEGGGQISETDSELEKETPQEKRIRLAKEYLSQVEAEIDEAVESDEDADDLMKRRLEHDAKKALGKHFVSVADAILEPQTSDIVILRGHKLALTCLVISPDNKYIYTGSKDCSLIKWDVLNKKKILTIAGGRKNIQKGHNSHIYSIAISSSSKFLASGDRSSNILIWNPESMELLHQFSGHKGPVTGLAFRVGSHQLFSCSSDKSVKIWSLDEMAYVETVFGHQDGVQSIDAMVKERAISVGGRDNTVRVWKVVDESQLVYIGQGGSLDCVSLVDEEKFLTGSDTNQICVWKIMKKWPVAKIDKAHEGDKECWISALRALRNSDLFASGSKDGKIKLWKLTQTGPIEHVCSIPVRGFINDMHFSPNGRFLAAAVGQEHKLGRWWKINEAKNCLVVINLPRKSTKNVFM